MKDVESQLADFGEQCGQPVVLSNAGLEGQPGETFFNYAGRAAAEHERRGDRSMAAAWRKARWDVLDGKTKP